MKTIFFLLLSGALAVATVQAQKTDQPEPEKKSNRSLDGTPLDPFKEAARLRAKEQARKNHEELKQAATELLDLSQKLSDDIAQGGEDVISARIFDRAEKIEKLAKRIRDKARDGF